MVMVLIVIRKRTTPIYCTLLPIALACYGCRIRLLTKQACFQALPLLSVAVQLSLAPPPSTERTFAAAIRLVRSPFVRPKRHLQISEILFSLKPRCFSSPCSKQQRCPRRCLL